MFKKLLLILSLFFSCGLQAKDYYVKVDGTGDGSTWSKALSATEFDKLLPKMESGSIVHIAEGIYHPNSDNERMAGLKGWKYNTRCFMVRSDLNFIGGYPSSVIDESQGSEPDKYKTIFSVDFNNDDRVEFRPSTFGTGNDSIVILNTEENDPYVIEIAQKNAKVSFYGLTIEGATLYGVFSDSICEMEFNKCSFNNNGSAGIRNEKESVIRVDSCNFIRNGVTIGNPAIWAEAVKISSFHNSNFEWNGRFLAPGGGIFVHSGHVENCSFYKNFGWYGAGVYVLGNSCILNCTFLENEVWESAPAIDLTMNGSKDTIQACTFINNVYHDLSIQTGSIDKFDYSDLFFIGNIVVGPALFTIEPEFPDPTLFSKHNIFTDKMWNINGVRFILDGDTLVDLEEIAHLLDGEIVNGKFVANIQTNRGNLRTVSLKNDTFSNGKSIRLPLSDIYCKKDIFDEERLSMTCPGSNEYFGKPACIPDSVVSLFSDTIQVGETFLDSTFTTIGVHDSIFETLKNVEGCDSVVMHTLIVKPESSGVDDVDGSVFRVYPNLVGDVLQVEGCDYFIYRVFEVEGCVLQRGESSGKIYVGNLSLGIYFLELETGDFRMYFKFMKR